MTTQLASHRPSSLTASLRRFFVRLADNLERTGSAQVRIELGKPWLPESETRRGAK